jgi:hypothetical protein
LGSNLLFKINMIPSITPAFPGRTKITKEIQRIRWNSFYYDITYCPASQVYSRVITNTEQAKDVLFIPALIMAPSSFTVCDEGIYNILSRNNAMSGLIQENKSLVFSLPFWRSILSLPFMESTSIRYATITFS